LPNRFFCSVGRPLSHAQKSDSAEGDPKNSHFMLVLEAQHLRSTHSQTIYGASLVLAYRISPSIAAGIGFEISRTDSLFTHDRYTTVLKFTPIPIYGEARIDLIRHSKVTPYVNLAAGMSSISYERKRSGMPGGVLDSKNVHQNGFFLKADSVCSSGSTICISHRKRKLQGFSIHPVILTRSILTVTLQVVFGIR